MNGIGCQIGIVYALYEPVLLELTREFARMLGKKTEMIKQR